jgi:type II secretory pathway pseudopilin PulG
MDREAIIRNIKQSVGRAQCCCAGTRSNPLPCPPPEYRGRGKKRRGGFTLLEGLVASVILVMLVIGVAAALSASYQQSQSVNTSSAAVTLARQLVDEIAAKPFVPTDALGTGGTRSTFTNVSAYNAYSDGTGAVNPLPLLEGGTLDVTGSQSYSRSASVTVGAKPSIDTASPTTDFGIVTVTVTAPDGQIVQIPEFVANYSIPRQ